MEPKELGRRIRQLREQRGLTQEQLADRIARDQRAVSLYESGQRRIFAHDIPAIAKALDVPLAYLFEEVITEDELDTALLKEFHRLDMATRKTMIEILRLFSDAILSENDD